MAVSVAGMMYIKQYFLPVWPIKLLSINDCFCIYIRQFNNGGTVLSPLNQGEGDLVQWGGYMKGCCEKWEMCVTRENPNYDNEGLDKSIP